MELLGFKKCSRCGKYLPLSWFPRDRGKKDGRMTCCSKCNKSKCKKYYAGHKRQMQASNTAYYREFRKQPMTAWKNKIRQETRQLILQGILLHPGCCEYCGVVAADETIHVHHLSYVRPDRVLFLCKDCHVEWHNENPSPPEPSKEFVDNWYETYQSYPEEDQWT